MAALCEKTLKGLLHREHEIKVFESIDSTNTYLRTTHAPHGALVCASHQSAGRGRRGKSFYSPAGAGVYFSLCLTAPVPMDDAWALTFMAAIAVCRTLRAAGADAGIKWVNDVYLPRGKVCGILTETDFDLATRKSKKIVMGIGLDLKSCELPPELAGIASSLEDAGISLSGEEAVSGIVNHLDALIASYDIPAVIDEYKKYCFILGRQVSFERNGTACTGIAQDIAENGNLKVACEDGEHILASGEISVRPI